MTTETHPEQIVTPRAGSSLGETMVTAVLGPKRRGKTLLASKMCFEYWLGGGKLYHMGNLSFGDKIEDIGMLADQDASALLNCLLYLDEVKTILNSRSSNSAFQKLIGNNMMQAGHQGLSIIWTSQFQSGISADLLDQCDYAIVVDRRSGQQPWRSEDKYVADTGKLKKANLCAGFDKSSPFHEEHTGPGRLLACTESSEKRTILYKTVTQSSHPNGPGITRHKTLHCAQRFYGLSDTTFKIDALAPMLMNTDQFRARQEVETIGKFGELLTALNVQGKNEITPAEMQGFMEGSFSPPIYLEVRQIRSYLKALGVRKVVQREDRWNLDAWAKA